MKILIAADLTMLGNPFVSTISSRLIEMGLDVTCSQEEFWNNPEKYDVIHFQWPEILFDWNNAIADDELHFLSNALKRVKNAGIPICITVHNLKPHTSKNPNLIKSFELIYGFCSGFFHMGEYSKSLLEKEYPQATHFIIPHHIYDSIYKFNNICEPHPWIEKNKVNLLSFGAFRNQSERNLLLNLIKDSRFKDVNFILPGFCKSSVNSIKDKMLLRLRRVWYKLQGIKFSSLYISDQETEQLFQQSDIVLIQRLHILNSGNLPLAFAAGKVVVGPNEGNVGAILSATSNPIFDPMNKQSIADSVYNAIEMVKKGDGEKNRTYANTHWLSTTVARQLVDAYQELLKR